MSENLFSHYLMPLAVAFIMFGIGINLQFGDFGRTFSRPKGVFTGLFAQMVLLPVVAYIINLFLDVSPVMKVGFILIAACPGGTTANLVTLLLRGRLALSVTLTAFNSFLILFTIPAIINLALYIYLGREQDITLPFLATVRDIFITVLIPTLGGMIFRHYLPFAAERIKKPVNYIMTIFLLFVFVGVVFFEDQGEVSIFEYRYLILPAFILNVSTMFTGYYVSKLVGLKNRSRFTIAIQVGLQNSALAIYVASKLLGQSEMAIVAVVYGSFTLFTTAFWAWIMKKYL
jgi:BASS family bile acid:Na+ symporter